MTTRALTRGELMAVEVGRALNFARATFLAPNGGLEARCAAAETVLKDHDCRLQSRFGSTWAEEAKLRGLL